LIFLVQNLKIVFIFIYFYTILSILKIPYILFSSKRYQEKVLEGQIHETKESLRCFDKIAKDNDIDVIPKALSVFEDFFFNKIVM
jgi:hypothetical protein